MARTKITFFAQHKKEDVMKIKYFSSSVNVSVNYTSYNMPLNTDRIRKCRPSRTGNTKPPEDDRR